MTQVKTDFGRRGLRPSDPSGGKKILWVKRRDGIDVCYPVAGKKFRNGMDSLAYRGGCHDQGHTITAGNYITWERGGQPCGADIEVLNWEHAGRLAKREIEDIEERRKTE